MDFLAYLAIAAVLMLVIACYYDRKAVLKRDKEHEEAVAAERAKPRCRLRVKKKGSDIGLYTDTYDVEHCPGQYGWIMSSRSRAQEAAYHAIRKGIKVDGKFLPATSIDEITIHTDN